MSTTKHPFSYCELHSQDPSRAKAFYAELFGWKTVDHETPVGAYTELEPGEGFPGGLMKLHGDGPSRWVVYLRVADLSAETQRAQALGAKVLAAGQEVPDTGWFSLLTDPTGATFGLWQPLAGK
jgi:predicted enzyme related to lactoylglutathione lyase